MKWDISFNCYNTKKHQGFTMKKTFLSLLFLGTSLFAQEGEWLLGLDVGSTGTSISQGGTSISEDKRAIAYGAKVGFQEGAARIFLAYNHADKVETSQYSIESDSAYVQLDGFGEDFNIIGSAKARIYLGAHIGAYIPTLVNSGVESGNTSLMGGVETGIIFLLPARLELEFAYRHMWTQQDNDISINAGNAYTALNIRF